MLKFISSIPISRRLLLAFLLAAVIPGIVISLLSITFIKEHNLRSRATQTNISAFEITTSAATHLARLNTLLNTAYEEQYEATDLKMQAQVQTTLTELHTAETAFAKTAGIYRDNYQINGSSAPMSNNRSILLNNDPNSDLPIQQQVAVSQVLERDWPDYQAAEQQLVTAIVAKTPRLNARQLRLQSQQKYLTVETSWNQVTRLTETISYKIAQIGPTETNPFILATVVAFLSTIIAVTAIGYLVYLTITRPLEQLTMLTRRIARGETNVRAEINGRDEISLVAQSMNNMLDNIVRLIQVTQLQRDNLLTQVEKLVSEVSGVGEGDLRIQAEVTTDALGVLADSFNYMVEELGSLVVRVKMVAGEVDSSTIAILDRMTQLVETGKRQLQQMAEAGAEVEQMAASSRQVAERSQLLYNVARMARRDAQIGRESAAQTVEGMERISENVQMTAHNVQILGDRSREINDIVEVISNIAHQTNRLALDAAIQAAMAGENGRAFGAVAADIRRLAERTKDHANMIARIVRSVREEIAAVAVSIQETERETSVGAQLTQEAGTALESIFAAVEHQGHEIEQINLVAKQQLQSSSAVVNIMQGVATSTRLSNTNTREASRQMERLARLVEQLRASVEAFKLRENQNYAISKIGTTITLEEEPENPLTVSGIFRKISIATRPAQLTNTITPDLDNTPGAPSSTATAGQQVGNARWHWHSSTQRNLEL